MVWAWLAVAVVAAIDLTSKVLAHRYLSALDTAEQRSWLHLGLVMNPGMSLGIERAHPALAATISALSIVVLAVWLHRAHNRLEVAALALAVGGGFGNLIDRLSRGAVTDWIHVNAYGPSFNLADIAIRVGLLMAFLALALRSRWPKQSETAADSASVSGLTVAGTIEREDLSQEPTDPPRIRRVRANQPQE